MNEKIKKQILAIRDSGLTNMLDVKYVQQLAFQRNFFELVCFIEENRKEYAEFIFRG
ncbi:MAG: DUF5049 domain-containing protein [Synergistaceae bacterium]|nr:DUF5049 domain-containing protein [Synergistaceae bacterium]